MNKWLIFLALLTGCAPTEHPISNAEVSGIYSSKYHNGVDDLLLFDNGEYEHSYNTNGQLVVERDKWEVLDLGTTSNTEVNLRLFNFRFRGTNGTLKTRSDWIVSAEKSERINITNEKQSMLRVRLCFNYDLDYCFIKDS